jgi:predicted ribosomally synthesized peptide with SipW-like signal peptide
MNFKKFALPLLLVIMLGAIGLSYAWWTETLTINGTVSTADINVIFNNDPWEHPSVRAGAAYYKWGNYTTASWQITDNGKTLVVTVGNLYPGAVISILAYIRNMGTIPVKFSHCNITILEDNKGVAQYIFVIPQHTYMNYDTDGNGTQYSQQGPFCPVWGGYTNFPFTLLDDAINYGNVPGWPNTYAWPKCVLNPPTMPGEWRTAGRMAFGDGEDEGCIALKVDPNAPNTIEGATLKFAISFTFVQWNA